MSVAQALMAVRRGGKPQAVDTVPGVVRGGARTAQSRVVDEPRPGDKPVLIAPGEIINNQEISADVVAPMVAEYTERGTVDGKKPSPSVERWLQSLQARQGEEQAEGEVEGFAGGGVAGLLGHLFESETQRKTRQDLEAMTAGTYQGQPPVAAPAPAPAPVPAAPAPAGGVSRALNALQGRTGQVDAAERKAVEGFARGGLVNPSMQDQLKALEPQLRDMTARNPANPVEYAPPATAPAKPPLELVPKGGEVGNGIPYQPASPPDTSRLELEQPSAAQQGGGKAYDPAISKDGLERVRKMDAARAAGAPPAPPEAPPAASAAARGVSAVSRVLGGAGLLLYPPEAGAGSDVTPESAAWNAAHPMPAPSGPDMAAIKKNIRAVGDKLVAGVANPPQASPPAGQPKVVAPMAAPSAAPPKVAAPMAEPPADTSITDWNPGHSIGGKLGGGAFSLSVSPSQGPQYQTLTLPGGHAGFPQSNPALGHYAENANPDRHVRVEVPSQPVPGGAAAGLERVRQGLLSGRAAEGVPVLDMSEGRAARDRPYGNEAAHRAGMAALQAGGSYESAYNRVAGGNVLAQPSAPTGVAGLLRQPVAAPESKPADTRGIDRLISDQQFHMRDQPTRAGSHYLTELLQNRAALVNGAAAVDAQNYGHAVQGQAAQQRTVADLLGLAQHGQEAGDANALGWAKWQAEQDNPVARLAALQANLQQQYLNGTPEQKAEAYGKLSELAKINGKGGGGDGGKLVELGEDMDPKTGATSKRWGRVGADNTLTPLQMAGAGQNPPAFDPRQITDENIKHTAALYKIDEAQVRKLLQQQMRQQAAGGQ